MLTKYSLCARLCAKYIMYVISLSPAGLKMCFIITPCLVETTGAQTEVAFQSNMTVTGEPGHNV